MLFARAVALAAAGGAAAAEPGAGCGRTADCGYGELCLRDGRCRRVVTAPLAAAGGCYLKYSAEGTRAKVGVTTCVQQQGAGGGCTCSPDTDVQNDAGGASATAASQSDCCAACAADAQCKAAVYVAANGGLADECFGAAWPNVSNCVRWRVSEAAGVRVCDSNDVPPYHVPAYCPYGVGEGYCQSPTKGDSTDCTPFKGIKCPCVAGSSWSCPAGTPAAGDVMVPQYQHFEFPLRPDPTDPAKPKHMYDNSALKNGNTYQVIGAHLNGVQLKGPAEANGYNVDTALIPLPCGGHVTPPVGPGPVYHYHKAADCVDIRAPGAHAPLVAWAADGFGIYGLGDAGAADPVLDECHGHFGPLPNGSVAYHYHASNVTNVAGAAHRPYYMGCQGPSKGRCNSTVSSQFDGGANWCGAGCGAEVCVQPGTDRAALRAHLAGFPGGAGWLDGYTTNDF